MSRAREKERQRQREGEKCVTDPSAFAHAAGFGYAAVSKQVRTVVFQLARARERD